MNKSTELRDTILKAISKSNLEQNDILFVLDEVEDIVF